MALERSSRPRSRAVPKAGLLVLLALSATLATAATSPSGGARPAATTKPRTSATKPAAKRPALPPLPYEEAFARGRDARAAEEAGLYERASATLRDLRPRTATDPDRDLALALDEARCGRLDAAAALLWSPALERALTDSLPTSRRHFMPWLREQQWFDGRFDAWNWYVARARFEVAFAQRRWDEARRAAAIAVAARPLAGSDWLALALATGQSGDEAGARMAAAGAAMLDPSLPEARYLNGLCAWRAGDRATAQSEFRAAAALDSAMMPPALALTRLRLPGAQPDSLPAVFLTGARRPAMLTSREGPKLEEFVTFDQQARLLQPARVPLDSAVVAATTAKELMLMVLLDERGRAVANLLPGYPPSRVHPSAVSALLGSLPEWRFAPAVKDGEPSRAWVTLPYRLAP